MKLPKEVEQKISEIVIDILFKRFQSFPEDSDKNRNAPFHESFLQAFCSKLEDLQTNSSALISLSSWLHGLNTSLGQTFFEKVAHAISGGEKREFTSSRSSLLQITEAQRLSINDIMINLSNSNSTPDLKDRKSVV